MFHILKFQWFFSFWEGLWLWLLALVTCDTWHFTCDTWHMTLVPFGVVATLRTHCRLQWILNSGFIDWRSTFRQLLYVNFNILGIWCRDLFLLVKLAFCKNNIKPTRTKKLLKKHIHLNIGSIPSIVLIHKVNVLGFYSRLEKNMFLKSHCR